VRVLAVDTTSKHGSLAVVDDAGILAETRVVTDAGHSRWLLPAVDAVLRGLGIGAAELDLFAVTSGPGSFTGLRVGIGTVQGLALASRRPCLGVSTLDVVAHGVAGSSGPIVVVQDAFRGEVFWAIYDGAGRLCGERSVGPVEAALASAPAGSAFVGDAALASRDAIRAAVAGASFPQTSRFLAATLGPLALGRAQEAGPPAALQPVYLRGAAIRPSRA
jgi:tRNA threonylcarbamoyladenosine biosynthesis protein TsaB